MPQKSRLTFVELPTKSLKIQKTNICARSYEDALILANLNQFPLPSEDDVATEAWEYAQGLTKADFALEYAIRVKEWVVPRYIREGLIWLSESDVPIQNLEPLDKGGAA